MSYDVVAYSFGASVAAPSELESRLGKWSILPTSMSVTRVLRHSSPFPKACMVLAWKPKKGLADIPSLVKARDEAALNALYAKDLVFSCPLNITNPFRMDPDELEDLAEYSTPAQRKALKAARIRYSTYTSAGRNSGSMELQMVLCAALAALYGGVLEDPQFGLLKVFKAA